MNSGFGSFGSPSGFNTSTSLFSSQNRQGGLFGSSTTTQPTSTAGSLFGSSSTTTPSTTSFGFGSTTTQATTTQTGTGNVKFSAPSGQDSVTKNGVQSTIQTNHQCITAMKDYEGKSLEELRLEDYQANRKFSQTTASGFGGSTGLFGSSTQSTSSGFGSTGLFGSSTSTTAGKTFGSFGSTTTTTTPSTSTSLFGSQAKPAFGGFGSTQPTTTSSPFGGFGSTTQPTTTTTGFGTTTQPSTGLFGSTSTTPSTGTSLFGSTTPSTSTTGGLFGSTAQTQQQKPIFGGFGSTTTPSTSTTTPSFSFGSSTTQPSQPSTSIFGQSTTQSPLSTAKPFGGFGTGTGTTTGFGSTSTTPSTGLFGSTQSKPTFGLGSTTGTTGTSGFGTGFGTTSTTGTAGTTGSIFGSGFGAQPAATTASPFGSTSTTSPFGSTTTGGGLFGSTQPSATATGTGLFGATTTPSTSTTTGFGFGTGTQPSTQTSLFGTSTTPSTGGLFGSSTTTQPSTFNLGSGLGSTASPSTGLSFGTQPTSTFGTALTQPAQSVQTTQQAAPTVQPLIQQQLMAMSNSPYGTASLLKTQLQDYSKKDDIFKPVSPIAQKPYMTEATSPSKASSILSQTLPEYKGGLSMTLRLTPKPITQVSKKSDLFEGLDEEETPVFYPRKNIKKLMFKPQADQSARLSTSNSSINGDSQFVRKPNFFSEQAQITNDLTNVSDDGTQTTDNQSENGLIPIAHPAGIVLERPGYFTIPSMSDLGGMVDPKTGDCLVENFAIGRVDYGCITFPGLTNLANLNLDEIVHIRRKEVHVYPDDSKKPPVGEGLNKPAEVTLHRIWPSDKQTRMPITDPNRIISMGYNKKIEKVTIDMDAEFIDYDPVTGSWTFKVKHFSKYGLDDSDDEDVVNIGQNNLTKGAIFDPLKKENEMIERQRKLIELRRFELMQQSKQKLSTITNQQWDIIKEYAPKNDKKIVDTSSLELSTDETSDADIETVDLDEKKKSICKQLVLDAEETVIDENKENKLYPCLTEFERKDNKVKTLYPNLDNLESSVNRIEIAENKEETIETDEVMVEVPFQSSEKYKETRKLTEAFFNDERESDYFAASYSDDYQFSKLASFSHKPITTGGLLKRGLGGISTLDQENKLKIGDSGFKLSSSLMGDQFHGQSKVIKTGSTETIKSVVPKDLKPQLWNRFKAHKPIKSVQRRVPVDKNEEKIANSEYQLVPSYSDKNLIELKDSLTKNFQWCLTDLGLFNSRRFRSNWSMNPSCYTFTELLPNANKSTFRNLCQIKSLNTFSMTDQIPSSKLNTIKENIEKFLKIQLDLTDFVDRSDLCLLKTKIGNELIKNLDECAENLRNSIGDNPDADNVENMRIVLNLCSKLWGNIPDELKSENYDTQTNQYETEQIRKRLLSEWLTHVSSHKIEKECKSLKFNKNKENYLNAIFSYLSGNRLLDACNIAIENSDYRLALIISQSSGSNDTVRKIMKNQLYEWFQSNSDKFIDNDRLKIYVLISGELVYNISGVKTQTINVCENLDWKRQFGIHLWFQSLPINSIADALNLYEQNIGNETCTKPMPSYVEESVSSEKNSSNMLDTCFHLIKLYCNSEYYIENIVHPLSHGSNQLDYRLAWHLTMALQALQYNHISKFSIENLHNSFAAQLQSAGLWHWAIYVLMHIENDQRREKFVRLYLSRNVSSQSDLNDCEKFIVEKLRVPSEWVYEYKALRAKYDHLDENQLELLIKAHKWNEAHHVLIEQIAPDLFISKKFEKLNNYLNLLNKESTCISRWNCGGLVYLDFIKLHQKQKNLFTFETGEEEKYIDDEMVSETNEQLMSLATRLKEFDCKSSKKLLCILVISQLVLKYFNVLNEMNTNDQEMEDQVRKMTKQSVEKAEQQTLLVPDQELLSTVMIKKVVYSKKYLEPKTTRSRY